MTLLVYPQFGNGALSQFPVKKTRRARTVLNRAVDGSVIKLFDPAGTITEWTLMYEELSDEEAEALDQFFASAEGSLSGFTFPDPSGNLFAWSDHLDEEVWQKDPLLALTGLISDPYGGTAAWRVNNGGTAGQSIAQTLAIPATYQYCLTTYLRSTTATHVKIWAGTQSSEYDVTSAWRRASLTFAPEAYTASVRFGVEVAAMDAIELFGVQVEAQAGPSRYKSTTRGGVYENAHLRDDSLAITKTGVNRHSCIVNIIHVNHL